MIYSWNEESGRLIYGFKMPNVIKWDAREVETDREEIKKLYNRWLDENEVLGLLYNRQALLNAIP